jgi:hypothetical protein
MCGVDRVLFSGAGMSLEAAWKQLGSSLEAAGGHVWPLSGLILMPTKNLKL